MYIEVIFMSNLVQRIIRNTSRTVLHEGIFQHSLRALYSCLFVNGIFAPVGAYLIKANGFSTWGTMEPFVRSDFRPNIFKVEFFE